tara:strand:+ start:29465 stop:30196 length:732 start_codon:yes stop_codon:yes gene_type:complete
MEKKIAFIFIGTNKYVDFFDDYYDGVMSLFLPDEEKVIYAFTDDVENEVFKKDNVAVRKIEHEPWPYITLKRFKYMYGVIDELEKFSDVIFLDADMVVSKLIPSSFLNRYDHFFGVHHPGQFMYGSGICEYESNKQSTAYTPKTEEHGVKYRQGCFWGGKNPHISQMIKELHVCVKKDLENGVIAAWHDESHLNRYFSENDELVSTLHAGFAYPQNWTMPVEKTIVHLDKNMEQFPRFRGGEK